MTVAEMLKRMSSYEFTEHLISHQKFNPIGSYREDIRAGMMIAPILNFLRMCKIKDPELAKATDWLLKMSDGSAKKIEVQSMDEMKAVFRALAQSAESQQKQAKAAENKKTAKKQQWPKVNKHQ